MATTSDLERRIRDQIVSQRAEAIDLLDRLLIAARDGEAAMQAIFAEECRALGYETETFEADLEALRDHPEYTLVPELAALGTKGRPNVVARRPGTGTGRSLFVFAHVDSYVLDPTTWRFDPYRATETDDGRVYGYGIADDRSGVAGMVLAARALHALGLRPSGGATLASCLGKHMGTGGTLAVMARGYGGDGAVYLHPAETGQGLTEFKAVTLGLMQFRVTVAGRSPVFREKWQTPAAHQGVNAIEQAAKVVLGLRAWAEERAGRISHPAVDAVLGRSANLSVARIEGGDADYRVPTTCAIVGSLTFPPGETVPQVRVAFEAAMHELAAADPWLREHPPAVEWLPMMANPAGSDLDGEFVGAFRASAEAATGAVPAVWPAHSASDIRYPLLYVGAPTVGFGPRAGSFGGPDEWLDVDDFLRAVTCLAFLMARWCGVTTEGREE